MLVGRLLRGMERDAMVSKKPEFKLVPNADSAKIDDLPFVEIIPDSTPSPSGPRLSDSFEKEFLGSSIVGGTGHVEPEPDSRYSEARVIGTGMFRGYPPLPVIVVGLSLILAMLVGE